MSAHRSKAEFRRKAATFGFDPSGHSELPGHSHDPVIVSSVKDGETILGLGRNHFYSPRKQPETDSCNQ